PGPDRARGRARVDRSPRGHRRVRRRGARDDGRAPGGDALGRGSGVSVAVAEELADRLVAASGGRVRAVLLYGSHLLRAAPDRHSAVDLVVLVDAYGPFHRALREAGELPRPAWLMGALARVLPPNVVAFAPDEGREGLAKCLVVDTVHFERGLRRRPPDHFLLARLVQRVAVLRVRRPEDRCRVEERLAEAD